MGSRVDQLGPMTITTFTPPSNLNVANANMFASEIYISKSDSPRRPKPTDLFANGTSLSRATFTHTRTYGRISNASGFYRVAPASYWLSATSTYSGPSADTDAIQAALRGKIKAQNVNLAQSMAEYRQAGDLFLTLSRDILKAYRSLRQGRAFADFVRILQRPRSRHERDIANRWLQYQYGWKPLMSDIYGVTEALASKLRTGMFIYVRASRTYQYDSSSNTIGVDGVPCYKFSGGTLDVRGVARYKIQDASLKQLAQMGISNPLLLAWELIPYSFVVDWAFPVGNFLSSLDALNGTSDLRAITSTDKRYVNSTGAAGGKHEIKVRDYFRSAPTSSLALPKLSYKPSTSLTAVLNGLALLTQFRTGR